jgi:hypothetical protein
MHRRTFLGLAGRAASGPLVVAAGWPASASAQQQGARMPRVAFLGAGSPTIADPKMIEQFKVGLIENDLIVGRNVSVDYFWAEGNPDRMRELANELARQDYDVIVTVGPQAYRFFKAAQTKSPIVLAVVGDFIADGIVDSLARPTGNVTGLSMSNRDLEAKRVEILKEVAPTVSRLMILHDPSMGSTAIAEALAAAKGLGMKAEVFDAADPSQFENAFDLAARARMDGLAAMASQESAPSDRTCRAASSAVHMGGGCLRSGWRIDLLRAELSRHVSPLGGLRCKDTQRSQNRGFADPATSQI